MSVRPGQPASYPAQVTNPDSRPATLESIRLVGLKGYATPRLVGAYVLREHWDLETSYAGWPIVNATALPGEVGAGPLAYVPVNGYQVLAHGRHGGAGGPLSDIIEYVVEGATPGLYVVKGVDVNYAIGGRSGTTLVNNGAVVCVGLGEAACRTSERRANIDLSNAYDR